MAGHDPIVVESALGKRPVDTDGAPVGVVHLDPDRSYVGAGKLLRGYINEADEVDWEKLKAKIDYTYESLDLALSPLNEETGFGQEVKQRVKGGQKLLFKPNLVIPNCIDPQTHGPDRGSTTCTEWPFIAALMRWFHDKLGISYHQMAVGEAATAMSASAGYYSLINDHGQRVTTEAVIEGRSGGFFGGWGFYFVRKYLAETHDPSHPDNPMAGYEESVAGTYLPPGLAGDRLMVYDLNRVFDDPTKGRDIPVPDGVNFQTITLHKAIVGGDPADPADRKAYPGCVLVNVPKLKVHCITLFTNVIKNLGIGLYPMQSTKKGGQAWDYSRPHTAVPGIKAGIPHQVWVPEIDSETAMPKRDATGQYALTKTGGILATMVDIIKAVAAQGTFMVHVVDAIEAINLDHTGGAPGIKEPEGLVFAGLDPVATDLLCARYMFGNVPLAEGLAAGTGDGSGGHFPQRVPVPSVVDGQIVTHPGYDCPLSRDISFSYAEKRGLGQRNYYVVGTDTGGGDRLVSLAGHLGRVRDGSFEDLVTKALYFDVFKVPWDLQLTTFNYLEAVDALTGSSLKQDLLAVFDDEGDGILTYEEFGRKGVWGAGLNLMGVVGTSMGIRKGGSHAGGFAMSATMLKASNPLWNADGHDVFDRFLIGATCLVALRMSQSETESPDPFCPSLIWGKGKWPSFQLASYMQLGISLFGSGFPLKVDFTGLYGNAFRYADLTQNQGRYAGTILTKPKPEGLARYLAQVSTGEAKPLDFIFYVPKGYGKVMGITVPNVEETSDPAKIFTANFAGGQEIWPADIIASASGAPAMTR